jgi:hypothetical protein
MEEWLVPTRLDAETNVYLEISTTVPSLEDHDWVWKLKLTVKQSQPLSPLVEQAVTMSGKSVWSAMVESGLSWDTALTHLATLDRPVLTHASSCCLCVGRDYSDSLPTDEFTYKVDILISDSTNCAALKKVTVSAASAMDASTTVTGLLQWLSVSPFSAVLSSTDNAATPPKVDVTIKAFAAQPRLVLTPWNSDSANTNMPLLSLEQSSNISTLRLHFLSLDDRTAVSYVQGIQPRHLHLVQCSTTTTTVYQALLSLSSLMSLTVSCTLLELAVLAPSLGKDCVVPDIGLSVHCMLDTSIDSSPFAAFCLSMYDNATLQRLSLQYLDLTDDAWFALLGSLRGIATLTELNLGFTDAFVDTVRRLTPERRTERSRAMQELVESCPALHTVTWPACQHDAVVVAEIEDTCRHRRHVAC